MPPPELLMLPELLIPPPELLILPEDLEEDLPELL